MKHTIQAMTIRRSGKQLYGSIFLAIIWTAILLLQLFHYDEYSAQLALIVAPEFARLAATFAATIVVVELFMLAYYLPVALSQLARSTVQVFAIAVPLLWLTILITNITHDGVAAKAFTGGYTVPDAVIAVGLLLLLAGAVKLSWCDRRNVHHAR